MRYYFHILYADVTVIDDEGQDFDCLDDAKVEGHLALQELAAEALVRRSEWAVRGIRISTTDLHEIAVITVDPLVERLLKKKP